jgi:hypothetical protein
VIANDHAALVSDDVAQENANDAGQLESENDD